MNNSKLFKVIAPVMIAGLVLGGCTASNTDVTAAANTDVTAAPAPGEPAGASEVSGNTSLLGFERPLEERNPAQQMAAGFLAVPLIVLYVAILPFML